MNCATIAIGLAALTGILAGCLSPTGGGLELYHVEPLIVRFHANQQRSVIRVHRVVLHAERHF